MQKNDDIGDDRNTKNDTKTMISFGGSSRLASSCLSATTTNRDWADLDQPAREDATDEQLANYDPMENANDIPRSYSDAVRNTMAEADNEEGYTPKQKERIRRTMILRRVPYEVKMEKVCEVLESTFCGKSDLMGRTIDETVETITRDKHDKRRMYVTFRTYEAKRHVARQGFQLGGITIPGEPGDVSGYIRDVPYFMDLDDLRQALRPYGNILKDKARTIPGTRIQMGGYDFDMDLHDGKLLPEEITVHNETIQIFDKNAQRQCTYCYRYGHLHMNCRQRLRRMIDRRMTAEVTAADGASEPRGNNDARMTGNADDGNDDRDGGGNVTDRDETASEASSIEQRETDRIEQGSSARKDEVDAMMADGNVDAVDAQDDTNDIELTEPRARVTEEEAEVETKRQRTREEDERQREENQKRAEEKEKRRREIVERQEEEGNLYEESVKVTKTIIAGYEERKEAMKKKEEIERVEICSGQELSRKKMTKEEFEDLKEAFKATMYAMDQRKETYRILEEHPIPDKPYVHQTWETRYNMASIEIPLKNIGIGPTKEETEDPEEKENRRARIWYTIQKLAVLSKKVLGVEIKIKLTSESALIKQITVPMNDWQKAAKTKEFLAVVDLMDEVADRKLKEWGELFDTTYESE